LFEAVAVLHLHASDALFGNELLKNPVLIDAFLFLRIRKVVLTVNEAIAEQDIVVSFGQIVTDAGAKQELLQVANGVVVAVLDFVVPVPAAVDFFAANVDEPIAQFGRLRCSQKWKRQDERKRKDSVHGVFGFFVPGRRGQGFG